MPAKTLEELKAECLENYRTIEDPEEKQLNKMLYLATCQTIKDFKKWEAEKNTN